MERKHSGFGIASFVISLLAGAGMLLGLLLAAGIEAAQPGALDEESLVTALAGLVFLGLMLAEAVAVLLGIGSLFQGDRKKIFGALGMGCASVTLFCLIALILLGLVMGG